MGEKEGESEWIQPIISCFKIWLVRQSWKHEKQGDWSTNRVIVKGQHNNN